MFIGIINKFIFLISSLIYLAVSGQLMWQSPFGPGDVKKKIMLASGHILKEKKNAKWNADWKEEKINQASLSDWQLAKVFSVEVSRTAQLLSPVLPLSFCFPLSLSHPSLASSPIITLSSPPKCLTKPAQYLSHFSLHCSSSSTIPRPPSHFLSQTLSRVLCRDAFIASHLRLQTDTPLILLFCNLQRERKSLRTCVTFKQLPQPILCTYTFSLFNSSEVVVLCYLFSLYSKIHDRVDKNRVEGKGSRPPL